MKYLLVFLVVAVAWHVWRNQRTRDVPPPTRPKKLSQPENMVHCDHCGVHLPQSDAISYKGRYYCSQTHMPQATSGSNTND